MKLAYSWMAVGCAMIVAGAAWFYSPRFALMAAGAVLAVSGLAIDWE